MGRVPRNRGKVLTLIGALTLDRVEVLMTAEGGTSGTVFLIFHRDYLLPTLHQSDLVVMDNLGAHHTTGDKKAIRAARADVLCLPPYGPDLNPIGLCWSKVKALLRKLAARAVRTLKTAVQQATDAVTQGNAEGWFIRCGYAVPCA